MLCLPPLLLAASITATNSLWFYRYGFEKYGVSQSTGLAPAELESAARQLLAYFNSAGEGSISVTVMKDGAPLELFNTREIAHLRDVKGLFRLNRCVLLGTAAYALVYAGVSCRSREERAMLYRGLAWGGGLTLLLMLALGAGILLGFDRLFIYFHLVSFANDLWQLDPARDYLIRLFPGGFWRDAAVLCTLSTAAGAFLLGGAGWYLLYRRKGGGGNTSLISPPSSA